MNNKGIVFFLILLFMLFPVTANGKKDMDTAEQTPDEKTAAILAENDGAAYRREPLTGEPVVFNEVWGFVMQHSMDDLDFDVPVTDIAFFSSVIDNYGNLDEIPDRSKLLPFAGRVHLVFSCDNRALVHFCLDPQYHIREKLEDELTAAAVQYDGLVIDMEYISARDRNNFLSFLGDMKKKLPGKTYTVCVPARTRTISDDLFPYTEIGKTADRVIIMAYDEHWSKSRPGPVASLSWCADVAGYALTAIPPEKIIMGLPFYGRTWTDENYAGAWRYRTLNRRLINSGVTSITRESDGIAKVEYSAAVNVTGYFDDAFSLLQKCRMYADKNIENVSFWCLNQEDPVFWNWIAVSGSR
ncbi:MAG: glycosyl hydrolase family 18 protein [Treponema sp.]|nr:glycosyl hydrolase family 18 protein [Treponema sp.]